MIFRPRVALTLLAALFLLALPAVASAAAYEVNSTADEEDAAPGAGGCLTVGLKCTLRAAIEESNESTGVRDEITFSSEFNRQLADTIVLGSSLPAIDDPVSILGGDCFGEDGPDAPCAGVEGPSNGAAVTVEGTDGVVIEGLSVTGASFGIDVVDGSEGFVAKNDWIGLNLLGQEAGNGTGIFLDPGSDGATIGGPNAAERNVISGNEFDGLDLQGASDAVIRGNYFGVNPPGPVGLPGGEQAIANAKDIEITDSTASGGVKAENNEIGETIEGAAATSVPCDGGCNVISGASRGIDLNGDLTQPIEAPASGPTVIHGNFIGLAANGAETVENTAYGILAGGADAVTVGEYPPGDANYLAGSSEGIVSEEGESFIARGNKIGEGPSGLELTRPGKGIFALDQSVANTANIEQNAVLANGVGIEQRGATGHITGNEVIGGSTGIFALGEPGGGLIAGNYVEAPSEYGVLVESPDNDIRENTIVESGAAGIRVKPPTGGVPLNGTSVGGSTEEKENVIEGSAGPAIEIFEAAGEPGSTAEITRNHGSSNGGLFIDLVNGANEGIAPPVVATALQSSATGTALPGAVVRVFRKASAEAGELQSFLGEAEADGSGNWKVAFPTVPAGTLVTATQTNENSATSELAVPVAAASESSGGGGGGGGGGSGGGSNHGGGGNNGGGNGNTKDKTPPDTKIVKGPPKKTHKTTVKFKFTATEAGSTFQCKMDRKPFKACASPKKYKKLKPGKHVFKVRAIDKAGNVDPTPAKRAFTVLR
ncbi:MAG TPA: NosD domain-containing protein [Solirubrobacterales bacterium]|nr:NosD domain-containing protein [Solirubrobacterales bacterium]